MVWIFGLNMVILFILILMRIDNDEINENFKLKCQHFFDMERKAIDAGEVDIEMADAYVSES